MEPCSVGTFLGKSEDCHKLSYTSGKTSLSNMYELDTSDRQLLCWRSGFAEVDRDCTICLHHKKIFLDRYASSQKQCCDPFGVHPQTKRTGGLREINSEKAKMLERLTGKSIKPGQKWCPTCVQKESEVLPFELQDKTDDEEFMPTSDVVCDRDDRLVLSSLHAPEVNSLNKNLANAGFSPLKPEAVSRRDIVGYGKRKCREVQSAASSELASCLGVVASSIVPPVVQNVSSGEALCADMDRLVDLLKEKMKVSSRQKQVQILTLAPQSWSITKTVQEFQVSEYKVKLARTLLKEKGVLGDVEPKLGRPLSKQVEERIKSFYQNDEYSRVLPGAKDFKSVREVDGTRIHKQKRLILMNLNELYENYKLKYPNDKVGLSKFCMLRPQECITVGCRGTHSVCVCTIHQNVKLMISALPSDAAISYHDLMKMLVCSPNEKLCMIHRCPNCPKTEALKDHLESLFEENDISAEDQIHYKQWVSTDHTTLQDCTNTLHEFLEILVEKVDKLTCHHFIAKHQSGFLTSLKENLHSHEAIIILDFAENYSFTVQDAAQGFHWDNSQATLHPFVAYFKDRDDKLIHCSMCVVSDHLQHSTVAVHRFQQAVLQYMKLLCPYLTKVFYFSDGAASQYKNFKNFANLVYHKDDFGLDAQWHFFATSHGKNACDGVGGTIKREAAKASLQAVTTGHILTPKQLYEWGCGQIQNVKFFFIAKEEVIAHEVEQRQRFVIAKTVSGTRNHHCYIPSPDRTLVVMRISGDDSSFVAHLFQVPPTPQCQAESPASHVTSSQCRPGQYIACMYDGKWWVGNIRELCQEENDVMVSFMHPHGPARSFRWPAREDTCWVPIQGILCLLSPPATSNGRQYYLDKNDVVFLAKK